MAEENNPESQQPKKSSPSDFPIAEYRLVPVTEAESALSTEDEIDLVELAKHIWSERRTIIRWTLIGAVIGVVVALSWPKEYKATTILMPEYASESGGGASDLLKKYGGLIGLGGGASYAGNSNAIRVDLYPQIVQSLPFQLELLDTEFRYDDYDTTATLYTYFEEIYSPGWYSYVLAYTIGLPFQLKEILFPAEEPEYLRQGSLNTELVAISKDKFEQIESLRQKITASLDEETGMITVSAQMPEPLLAAKVTQLAVKHLTEYLVEYRTEKVMIDLQYVEKQLAKAKQRFEESQLNLAEFRDSNRGALTARAQTEEQRLNSEYNLAFEVYNSLAQQLEQAKLKVQEETPVFKVLQPVQIPVDDETSGAIILIIFVMLSGIASLGWIFIRQFIASNFS